MADRTEDEPLDVGRRLVRVAVGGAQRLGDHLVDDAQFLERSAGQFQGVGGLAGVWAEENTREAIFDALKRKEVFATSGTRAKVRFFGGWNFLLAKFLNRNLINISWFHLE